MTLPEDDARASLERLNRLAELLDSRLRIPLTDIRFGLDALIGLIPGVGDLAGMAMGLYLYFEATRLGVPGRVKARMLGNIAVDTLVGLVPVVGDLFDVAWRANLRNTRLLQDHLQMQLAPPPEPERVGHLWLLLALALALAVVLTALFWPEGAAAL